ncbi:MAG: S8 family peptidase [Chloroflexi bacterium]|nr:S8 family peptidase [Chloroflexota bacterium]
MPREDNFIIGQGERLTYEVDVPSGGNQKVLPYDFGSQLDRLDQKLSQAYEYISSQPPETCPSDRAVAVVTMHPRFIAKSDFPDNLFSSVGLRAIGSRSVQVAPERWGTDRHPEQATTDELFVAGARQSFARWAGSIRTWDESSGVSGSLRTIENVSAFHAETKVRSIPDDRDSVMLEVILHNASDEDVVRSFIDYASLLSATVYTEKRRDIGGLTFFPVEVGPSSVVEVARHSFVRVAREMPSMRPLHPGLTRDDVNNGSFAVALPSEPPLSEGNEAAIFDGGIPNHLRSQLSPWVSVTEPSGIGPPNPSCEAHGLAVTSAFLFGQLSVDQIPRRPLIKVDHIRVLDQNTVNSDPLNFEYFEVVDRITSHLDQNTGRYQCVNLSIGPSIPVSDDEISYWTSALDERFACSQFIPAVAVGNSGKSDAASGLNRIQPPADAVNALSVGAADKLTGPWRRADYSSVGPGRAPGLVKPDGVAFGGTQDQPFHVIGANSRSRPVSGTSFATPLLLNAAAGLSLQLGSDVNPLAIRALMIHKAQDDGNSRQEVGWGKFELDPNLMITCPDDEAVVLYQGVLPIGSHLRAPIPMPSTQLEGMVTITATILIAPNVCPEFVASYTESGFEATFRPHSARYNYRDGKKSLHPKSKSFFSENAMYGGSEFELREGGLKWEPCVKSTKRFRATSLSDPVFDIYNHGRQPGSKSNSDSPVPYALVIGIKTPSVPDLYNQIVRTFAGVLIPITPKLRLPVTVTPRIM